MQRTASAVIRTALVLAVGAPARGFAAGAAGVHPDAAPPKAPSLEQALSQRPLVNGPLSIEETVVTALRESPVIRGAAEEVEADRARLEAAQAQRRLQLSTTSFGTGGSESSIYNTPEPVRPANLFAVPRGAFFDQNVTLMLPLYTGGRLRALVRQAAAARGSAGADLEGVRQEVALMTRTAFRTVLARRALIDVAQAALSAAEEQLRVDQSRFQAGAIPEFYLARDEAERASAQQQLTNAQRDAELALVQLKSVMGIHPDSAIEPAGSLVFEPAADVITRLLGVGTGETSPPAPPRHGEGGRGREAGFVQPDPGLPPQAPPSLQGKGDGGLGPSSHPPAAASPDAALDTPSPMPLVQQYRARLLALAERQRPELQAARLRVEQAAQGLAVARSADRPQIGIAAMGDFMTGADVPTFGGASFGVTASLPLLDAGLRRANRRAAEAERRRGEQEYEQRELEIAQQVTDALLTVGAAEQNVTTAQAGARAAEAEYGAALQRYQAGRGILVEALDALAARTRARTNVVQALYDDQVALDQLRRAVGQPEVTHPGQPIPAPAAK